MDAYQRSLMQAPSVPRQPYCPVCGKAGPLTEHHVVPRSQGGKDGPTIYLCGHGTAGCHGLAEDNRLHFWHRPDAGWLFMVVGFPMKMDSPDRYTGWQFLSIYDECRDTIPFDDEDTLGELAGEIREKKRLSDTLDYLLSRDLVDAAKRLGRKDLAEWCVDNLDISPRSVGSYLAKRIAYGLLPDTAATLGITNGYMVAKLAQEHPLHEVLANFGSMSRSQFLAEYGLSKKKHQHTCPDCGQVHSVKGES